MATNYMNYHCADEKNSYVIVRYTRSGEELQTAVNKHV